MYYQYPLEVLARQRGAKSQLDFARTARAALLESEEMVPEAMARGLMLFAANEEALARPVRALEEMYGDELQIRGPRVRMLPGKPPQEPIMLVRIATSRATIWQVVQELRVRQAHILEECMRGRLVVVRAMAPLSLLVGLPAVLENMTGGDARCVIRLDRYAPLRNREEGACLLKPVSARAGAQLPCTGSTPRGVSTPTRDRR
jgi:hypothetical protein